VVARSSAEAEFLSHCPWICELLWLKILLKILGYGYKELMSLYYDDKAVINFAHNPVQHDRTKPIEIDRHKGKIVCGVDLYILCKDRGTTCGYFNKMSIQ
jgi:hypothetical protein